MTWLQNRGLTDKTILRAGLGFNAVTHWDEKEEWGVIRPDLKKVWVSRGITIPWRIDRQLWKVSVRRSNVDMAEDERQGIRPRKYTAITGGSSGIYGIDVFNHERPSVLVEGEFDAMVLAQQIASGAVNVLATGSTDKGQGERWALTIAQSQVVLISFDADEGGQSAARDYWLKSIPHAILWRPWANDINDMHIQGLDVAEWFSCGLEMSGVMSVPSDHCMSLSVSQFPVFDDSGADLSRILAQRNAITLQPLSDSVQADIPTSTRFHLGAPAVQSIAAPHREKKDVIPRWLVPGNAEWDKQVERCGLAEMQERRAAWFVQQQEKEA